LAPILGSAGGVLEGIGSAASGASQNRAAGRAAEAGILTERDRNTIAAAGLNQQLPGLRLQNASRADFVQNLPEANANLGGERDFNGVKIHANQEIERVWGGANSGIDGGNDQGRGITDVPGGLKLQCEGHDVRFRNVWIKEMVLERANTGFLREN